MEILSQKSVFTSKIKLFCSSHSRNKCRYFKKFGSIILCTSSCAFDICLSYGRLVSLLFKK